MTNLLKRGQSVARKKSINKTFFLFQTKTGKRKSDMVRQAGGAGMGKNWVKTKHRSIEFKCIDVAGFRASTTIDSDENIL